MSVSLALRTRPIRALPRSSHGRGVGVKGHPEGADREGVGIGSGGTPEGVGSGTPSPEVFHRAVHRAVHRVLHRGAGESRSGLSTGEGVVHRVFHRFFHRLWTHRTPSESPDPPAPPSPEGYPLSNPYGVPTVYLPGGVRPSPSTGSDRPAWTLPKSRRVQSVPAGLCEGIRIGIQSSSTTAQGGPAPPLLAGGAVRDGLVIHRVCGQTGDNFVHRLGRTLWTRAAGAVDNGRTGPVVATGPHRAPQHATGPVGPHGPPQVATGRTGPHRAPTGQAGPHGRRGRAWQGRQGRQGGQHKGPPKGAPVSGRGPRRGPRPSPTGGSHVPSGGGRWVVVVGAGIAQRGTGEDDGPPVELHNVGVGAVAQVAGDVGGGWWWVVHE